jgi:energy-coupling factor transporter ATP-binding protein EcfA2
MTTLNKIIQWAKDDLAPWQSDAVRRIVLKETLAVDDIIEIANMLKEKNGISCAETIEPIVLEEGHVSGGSSGTSTVILKALNNVQKVNAIPNGSSLPFGHKGVSIIYGENGAGKSGYARVLKKACNARHEEERILPNVFEGVSADPATATLKAMVDEVDQEIAWSDGTDKIDVLSNILVFDAKCARVIVDEKNNVSYLPYGADVFMIMVDVLKQIRQKLEEERPTIKKLEIDGLGEDTKASRCIDNLAINSKIEDIRSEFSWSDDDEKMLISQKKDLADAENQEIVKKIKANEALLKRIDILFANIKKIREVVGDETKDTLNTAIKDYNEAEAALKVASSNDFSKEPLEGVGGTVWKSLYLAAKKYSEEAAYKEKEYPALDNEGRCVLCMQVLSDEAKQRMLKFKSFMNTEFTQKQNEAVKIINEIISNAKRVEDKWLEQNNDILDAIKEFKEDLPRKVEAMYTCLIERKMAIINVEKSKNEVIFSAFQDVTDENIKALKKVVDDTNDEMNKKLKPEVVQQLKSKVSESTARKTLNEKLPDVENYIEALNLNKKYEECIKETETKAITTKGTAIVSEALTPLLKDKLQKELKDLGAQHLPIKFKKLGSAGETLHKMELEGCKPLKRTSLTEILSEGEQRVVALAGFFAEANLGDSKSAMVFDDPVCSLDHRYRTKIAKRIAKESEHRQIIVFTHDLAFLHELENYVNTMEEGHCCIQTIIKQGDRVGIYTEGYVPWHAMDVNQRLSHIEEGFNKVKGFHGQETDKYNMEIGRLYGLLREVWEKLVEERMFNKVVTRFQKEVMTQRLTEVFVRTCDYKDVFIGMKKCSSWMIGHDQSESLDENRPDPEEFRNDLLFLQQVRDRIIVVIKQNLT